MPWDAINIHALAVELNNELATARLEKIRMPDSNSLLLTFHSHNGKRNLILSAGSIPCCYITSAEFDTPATPPAFCMHLRKHLSGAILEQIITDGYERTINFRFRTKNDLRDTVDFHLITELMGKHSNIIAVNTDGIISDSIKRITPSISSKRLVLPNLKYLPPPIDDRITISDTAPFASALNNFTGGDLTNFLLNTLKGVAPITLKEILFRANIEPMRSGALSSDQVDRIISTAKAFLQAALQGKTEPCLNKSADKYQDFYFTRYSCVDGDIILTPTISQAVDTLMSNRLASSGFVSRRTSMASTVNSALKKTAKKLTAAQDKLTECLNADTYRIKGELLTANLYRIRKGDKVANVHDYYTDTPTDIALDPLLTPQQNAQRFYKQYNRLKTGAEYANAAIQETSERLDYLESVSYSLNVAENLQDLEQISFELEKMGLIKKRNQKNNSKPAKTPPLKPKTYNYEDFTILVGRNNTQNDMLVKSSQPEDIWLHAHKIHGAHVIIKNKNASTPPNNIIAFAAGLAARHSQASAADKIPVDFTRIRHVHKISGAPAGKVNYSNETTVMIKPLTQEEADQYLLPDKNSNR